MRIQRHIQPGMHAGQPAMPRHTAIARKAPAQATLPRVAGDETAQAREDDEALERNRAGSAVIQRAKENLEDGDAGGRGADVGKVADNGEEDGDGEEPAGDEADGDGAHDGNGHHFLRTVDFLGEMRGAVETGESPVCVDEADDEGDAVFAPAGVVDEGGEDEARVLVGGCYGGDGDEDDEEGDERGPERGVADTRQNLAVAVEEEAEEVRELVGKEDVPGFDRAFGGWATTQHFFFFFSPSLFHMDAHTYIYISSPHDMTFTPHNHTGQWE